MDKTTQIDYKISAKDFIKTFKDIIKNFASNKEENHNQQNNGTSSITLEQVIKEEAKLGSTKRMAELLHDFNSIGLSNKGRSKRQKDSINENKIEATQIVEKKEIIKENDDKEISL